MFSGSFDGFYPEKPWTSCLSSGSSKSMKRLLLESLIVLSLSLSIWAIPGLGQVFGAAALASLQGLSINLPVEPIKQLKTTSCGEAVIAMVYQYAYPKTAIAEREILTYAEMQGYYTEKKWPFTSPANMVKIIQHYTRDFSTGTVGNSDQGLALLIGELQIGQPILIDSLTRLEDPHSGAHFVLVTGISVASDNKYAITIYYNEPLTGKKKSAPWYGDGGLWNAWHNNGDPGGSGWWLSIPVSSGR
jgi:hypothetical protein